MGLSSTCGKIDPFVNYCQFNHFLSFTFFLINIFLPLWLTKTFMMSSSIEIMDTTLRDGEQTLGVSFPAGEKLIIASILLDKLHVNRIEVASARVSKGEKDGVERIMRWAERNGHVSKVEVLGFVDGGLSLEWIHSTGCKVINLLTKGSLKHCTYQLKKSPDEHIADIKASISMATEMGIKTNIYLEDWSNGMKSSPEYVYNMIDQLKDENIDRFMLPDTLGVLNPENCFSFLDDIVKRYPTLSFDFHAHNDYDLAVANVFSAIKAGVTGIHTTINGLGERAGNAPLSSVVTMLHDQLSLKTDISEEAINYVSHIIESYSGLRIPSNKPVIGASVFTQCAGIHADGDNKNNLYFNDLLPERFGRTREYALGKTSGKANIKKNLEVLGIELDHDSMLKVTEKIIQLGDKKEIVTTEDLPYIISDVINQENRSENIKVLNYSLVSCSGLRPVAIVKLEINGQEYESSASAYGQYDAFMKAIKKVYEKELGRNFPKLSDYNVTIPPGGKSDALVQTYITWEYEGTNFKTRGLDADQTEAAIKATIKMLNMIEN